MKDILISLLLLLVIIVVRGSYDKSEIDHVPQHTLTFESLEDNVNPDEEIFWTTDL